MKLSGSYLLPGEPAHVYALLQDPDVLAKCIPGCDQLVRTAPDEYEMKMKLLIASVSGLFDGKVRLTDHEAPHKFAMHVEGKGKIGFLKGAGNIVLSPGSEGTDVKYEGDVQLGGTIAAVGQRLVDTTSKMMLKRFFEKLAEISKSPAQDAAS